MDEVLLTTLLVTIVLALVLILFERHGKRHWKTPKMRQLVYEGVVSEYKRHDRNFSETKSFKKKFNRVFNNYHIADVCYSGPADVELFYFESVVDDICNELGGE